MSVYRVLRTTKATLSRTFFLDEEATDATGSVLVDVTRLDGTVVQGPVTTTGPTDHSYSFTFDGRDVLDELVVTWTATVGGDAIVLDQDVIQVVGGFYLGLGDIRNKIDPVFKNTERYPTQDLIDRRIEMETEFERICGQAFVPRFARDVLSGPRRGPLKLRWPLLRKVRSITVGGVAVAQDAVDAYGADDLGLLRHATGAWTYGTGNIVVEYEHGRNRPDAEIQRAARLRMKSLLLTTKSPLPDRAERIATTEIGLVQLAIASKDATGLPDVDAILERHPNPRPDFA